MFKRALHKALFISPGGIGNLVLALPALRSLKDGLPGLRMTLFTVEPGVENILDGERLVDAVICIKREQLRNIGGVWECLLQLRAERFDLAVTAGSVNPLSAGLLMWAAGIPCRAGENIDHAGIFYTVRAPYVRPCHETQGALNIIRALGLKVSASFSDLRISDEEALFAEDFLHQGGCLNTDTLIGVHPGASVSAGQRRRWPKENFVRIIRILHERGVRILLVAGPAERDLAAEIEQMAGVSLINTNAALSLRQTAAVIKQCRQFISNDSGVAHIAAAVGVPLVVLFGSTDPLRTAPRGEQVVVLKTPSADPVSGITVEEVLSSLNKF